MPRKPESEADIERRRASARARMAKYRQTEKGKANDARCEEKRKQSPGYKERRARYDASEERRAARAEYAKSERGRAVNKKCQDRFRHSERRKEWMANWAQPESDKIRRAIYAQTPERKAAQARWAMSPAGKASRTAYNHKRRLLRGQTPIDEFASPEYVKKLRAEQTTCAYCCKPLDFKRRHIDHVIPIAKGGKHIEDNLVICCQSCNSSKGAKGLIQWLMAGGHIRCRTT